MAQRIKLEGTLDSLDASAVSQKVSNDDNTLYLLLASHQICLGTTETLELLLTVTKP